MYGGNGAASWRFIMKLSEHNVRNNAYADNTDDLKKTIRREFLLKRRSISEVERKNADTIINSSLLELLALKRFDVVCAYASDGTEPDLYEVMNYAVENGITLLLPRFKSRTEYDIVVADNLNFVQGRYDIPEPPSNAPEAGKNLLDRALFLVPGVAYDEQLNRLGRGAGIYDGLLAKHGAFSIGVFYQCQKCSSVPCGDHDRQLDGVMTENGYAGKTFLNK